MHFYTYKITNLINGKIYIGVHKTTNLKDGYMGSGKILNLAKLKYGIENFHKDILMFHPDESEMFEIEALIVDNEFLDRSDTYNIKLGGEGGWSYVNSIHGTESKRRASILGNIALTKKFCDNPELKTQWRLKISKGVKATYNSSTELQEIRAKNIDWSGRKHTKETKYKMSISAKGKHKGEKNSQFGKMWIHSLEERKSTRINNNEPIPNGWKKGRKMFKN